MRKDITIDRKQVLLPNTSTIGYGKYKAQFGDIVFFDEGGKRVCGRVIGRINHAPRIENDPDVNGFLVVIALGNNLSFTMERWVNPDNVQECFNPQDFGQRNIAEFLAFFYCRGRYTIKSPACLLAGRVEQPI